MNAVDPIKDKGTIQDIVEYLRGQSERNAMLFLFGIYSGLRISDILPLRVRDVRNKEGITVTEKKTGKGKRFPFNNALKRELVKYIEDKKDYEYLFKSRKGSNRHISRQQAYNILRNVGNRFDLELIGTHTMRKTFGYHLYQQTHDIVLVQKLLNHASPEITLAYIGMTQERMDQAVKNLRY